MNHKEITKQLMDVNQATFDPHFNATTKLQNDSEILFFHFVDKNPLFQNNSPEAVNEYILASRKRRSDFKSDCDEGYKRGTNYFISNRLHHRDK